MLSWTASGAPTTLTLNAFRDVNIALANELALMSDRLGIDAWEVIDAAATKPFGFMKFTPGPGLGGHCIPIDPFYLSWKAKQSGFDPRFIELAGHINAGMPHYVVEKVAHALNQERKAVNGSRVLVLGAAYKRDIDDLRRPPVAWWGGACLGTEGTQNVLVATVKAAAPDVSVTARVRDVTLTNGSIDDTTLGIGNTVIPNVMLTPGQSATSPTPRPARRPTGIPM